MLNRAPILIVEDEPIIALELQAWVEDADGTVVGVPVILSLLSR